MSDQWDPYAGFEGDDGGLSNDDYLSMLVGQGMNGGYVPGKSGSQRLAYLKSFTDFMDVPFEAMFGQNPVAQEPEPSATRGIYGGDPAYSAIFDQIDQGQAPGLALKNVGVAADDEKAYDAAVAYATERTNRKPVTDWSSKSEYELMGAPTQDELVKRIANNRRPVGVGGIGGMRAMPKVSRMEDLVFQAAAKKRIGKAQNTMVRSDAQQDLVRRILATRAATGD